MDFLPCWSPEGEQLAFVRDTGSETLIQVVDKTGKELMKIDHANASELDPYFSPDGNFLYYSSSADGTFDVWGYNLKSLQKEKITTANDGMEMRPVPFGTGGNFYFISKAEGVVDRIKKYDASTKSITIIDEGRILSQLWMDTNTQGDQLTLNWSNTLTWDLHIKKAAMGAPHLELVTNENYVTYPSWNKANESILFSMAGVDLTFEMYEIPQTGGSPVKLEVKTWDYGASIKNKSFRIEEDSKKTPARVSVKAENGHFIIPSGAVPRFDSQNGEVFFYTDGEFTLDIPSDKVSIKASKGLFTYAETGWIVISEQDDFQIELKRMWKKSGWYSGDHHFHLNYGGPFKLQPDDLMPILKAEDLDFATPMVANLHFQLKDQEYLTWENAEFPKIRFGQEVRSHFHGHIGLFGSNDLFFPWFWGPVLYESHTYDDRTNDEVLIFGRGKGQIGSYVHPISDQNPILNEASMSRIPVGLVADVVNNNLDAFEVACLWSDEIGSSIMYHQFLNLGIPVALTAGTDAFPGYARGMAVGTTRIFVNTQGNTDWNTYLDGVRKGRSLVTNGPMIDFKVDGSEPGQLVNSEKKKVTWEMEVFSKNELDKIEILVNGKVVWSAKKPHAGGTQKFSGSVSLPSGGWVATRVSGSGISWPQMDSYSFAHTSPIWIGKVGSFDPVVRRQTAALLLKILDLSWARVIEGYKINPVDVQEHYFQKAKEKLERMKIE